MDYYTLWLYSLYGVHEISEIHTETVGVLGKPLLSPRPLLRKLFNYSLYLPADYARKGFILIVTLNILNTTQSVRVAIERNFHSRQYRAIHPCRCFNRDLYRLCL